MNQTYNKILENKNIPHPLAILIIILMNWLLQSILYTSRTEKIFKITLDVVLIILISLYLINFVTVPVSILCAFIIAHTLNWLFNSNIISLLKTFKVIRTTKEERNLYVSYFKQRAIGKSYIEDVFLIGSHTSSKDSEYSDVDVRLIRHIGILNGILASIYIMAERTRATVNLFPLDVYVFDSRKEMTHNEVPQKLI